MKNNFLFSYKKIYFNIAIVLIISLLSACSERVETNNTTEYVETTEIDTSINTSNNPNTIKNFGKLVTLQCSYHNVAVSTKDPGEGVAHMGEIERNFWIKYTCDVSISYDTHQIEIKSKDENITLKLPKPDIELRNFSYDKGDASFVESVDATINPNPITTEDREGAIKNAQGQLKETIEQDDILISRANDQAKKIIESYINEIGKSTGKEYNINWEEWTLT